MIYRPVQWRLRYNAGNVEKATGAFGLILRASISSTTRKESWVWLALKPQTVLTRIQSRGSSTVPLTCTKSCTAKSRSDDGQLRRGPVRFSFIVFHSMPRSDGPNNDRMTTCGAKRTFRQKADVSYMPIVLQNSFWITEDKFSRL